MSGGIIWFSLPLIDGGHAAWGVGTLGVLAVPILTVRSVAAAAPALREWAVHTAVVVVAGLVPHKAFKGSVIAIGKIHWIPPFAVNWAARCIYKKLRFTVKRNFGQTIYWYGEANSFHRETNWQSGGYNEKRRLSHIFVKKRP